MAKELREACFKAAKDALTAVDGDPNKVDKGRIAAEFVARGVNKSTAYMWIAQVIGQSVKIAGMPDGMILPPVPVVKTDSRPPVFVVAPDDDAVQGLADVMGGSAVMVVQELMACVQAAKDVMAHSRKPDGSVRIAKNLMAASEHLRRTLETAARLHESMVSLQNLHRYMNAIFAELRLEDAAFAQRVLNRIRAVDAKRQKQEG